MTTQRDRLALRAEAAGFTIAQRDLDDDRYLHVVPLTYGRARLHVGSYRSWGIYDDGW